MTEPLHSNHLTRTFRIVSKVIHIVDIVVLAVATAIMVAAAGVVFGRMAYLTANGGYQNSEWITCLAIGITLVDLIPFLMIPMLVYSCIANKQVSRPGHEHFLGLGICGFIFCDYVCGAFAIIIYITEGRIARRDAILNE